MSIRNGNSNIYWIFPLFFVLPFFLQAQDIPDTNFISDRPHIHAHAHNDYEHDSPLWDALRAGFTSFEADVWPIKGKLLVKHTRPRGFSEVPELELLYLAPLSLIVRQNKGWVYPDKQLPVYLMIDIKTDPEESYRLLQKLLVKYKSMLSGKNPPVKIFLSGARPIQTVLNDTLRLVGIDGRPGDLQKGYSPDFMPVVSERYSKVCAWRGKGDISDIEFQKIKDLADACHREGKKLRLWASPETRLCWDILLKAGVDLINTDKLEELDSYLREKNL